MKKSSSLYPRHVDAPLNLSIAYSIAERWADLEDVAKRHIALRPNEEMGSFNLGCALAALDRLDESAEAFRAALHVQPDSNPAAENLEFVLREAERLRAGTEL